MTFEELLDQAIDMLRRRGRVTYRALKLQFHLDDETLDVLKDELIEGQQLASDEDGRVLLWAGPTTASASPLAMPDDHADRAPSVEDGPATAAGPAPHLPDAERRQLTVLFGDLVDSTALAVQLDPEDLREVVRAYQATCAAVIQRFEGYIAQYLGDGLLVYFGYPRAHEDDAQRAVRAGLGIVEAVGQLTMSLPEKGLRLAVRVGIHTGLVVVGEMGGGTRQEQLALGDTPNMAARLQSLAAPNRVVISERTRQLVGATFDVEALGVYTLKGMPMPQQVYGVHGERAAESRFEAASTAGLTPLVGREEELGLVLRRWAQARAGEGQVVLLTGEPGIGKSRLLQALRERVAAEPHMRLSYQCSPYHANSAFYPVMAQLAREARFEPGEPPAQKLDKLEALLAQGTTRVAEVAPLLAALWALPTGDRYPPLALSPERHKAQTIAALVDQVAGRSRHQPVLCLVEDAHWCDPTTLEVLDQLVHRVLEVPVLVLITARPEFTAPWTASHLTTLTLTRLGRGHVATMVAQLTAGKALPSEVMAQILARTDGVPLFVEELTKTILESGLLCEIGERYALTGPLPPLAIPATVQDSLMARLDRLAPVKEVAQLGAALGREFSYALLAAVSPVGEPALPDALEQLVGAGLLFRRGQSPEAHYRFKHALVQDAAYASLLKSTRQQLHRQIATVLEARFPAMAETEPEVLARHYTEAGLPAQAIPYWQRAGERALARSAYREADRHLTTALALLTTLPESRERSQQELVVQMNLSTALRVTKGAFAPEVEQLYIRARALCEQVGEPPQLFRVLFGLWIMANARGDAQTMRVLGEQLLSLAQDLEDPDLLLEAHHALWTSLFSAGELLAARAHQGQGLRLYDPQCHRAHIWRYGGHDPGVCCRYRAAPVLWLLGYPDQALASSQAALALAQQLAHPATLIQALYWAAVLHHLRREAPLTQARAEAAITAATPQEFPNQAGNATPLRGWALAASGHGADGRAQIQQSLAAYRPARWTRDRPYHLALLAEASAQVGQTAAGLDALAEALETLPQSAARWWEAELYRLRGELLLHGPVVPLGEAEACFRRALDVARRQQARSLELRTAMSLSRLWQSQGKRDEARELLAPIYGWFTEGFETADLQEAKALLTEVS